MLTGLFVVVLCFVVDVRDAMMIPVASVARTPEAQVDSDPQTFFISTVTAVCAGFFKVICCGRRVFCSPGDTDIQAPSPKNVVVNTGLAP
jgi:hypothetical protein